MLRGQCSHQKPISAAKTRIIPQLRRFQSAVANAGKRTTHVQDVVQGQQVQSPRRTALLGLLGLALSQHTAAAWAKPALLDLPACNKFKQAGAIQYCDLSIGSGDSPLAGDLIVVDYTARAVATGQVYDGSRSFKFTAGNDEVIPGWEVGILGDKDVPAIKEGGCRTLLIPPELAYGRLGDGCLFGLPDSCRIPPNSPVEITFKYRGLGY